MKDILQGELVRLSAVNADEFGRAFSHWLRDTEFKRLIDSGVSHVSSSTSVQKWIEKELEEEEASRYWFSIRKLDDDNCSAILTCSWSTGAGVMLSWDLALASASSGAKATAPM